MIWERFLEGFGGTWRNMCEALQVAGLALMIRATRSRSMDGWMDGWMDGRTDGRTDGWTDRRTGVAGRGESPKKIIMIGRYVYM